MEYGILNCERVNKKYLPATPPYSVKQTQHISTSFRDPFKTHPLFALPSIFNLFPTKYLRDKLYNIEEQWMYTFRNSKSDS